MRWNWPTGSRRATDDGLAQGEQGKAADNRGQRPLLRGWLHAGAFFAWLIGGPFLIAAAPDACGDGRVVGLRGRHAGHVRHQRRLPPPALVGAGLAPHAAGRSQRDLRRNCRRRPRPWSGCRIEGVGRMARPRHGLGGGGRRYRPAAGLPGRAAVGRRHSLCGGRLVPDHRGAPTGAQPRLGRLRPDAGGGPGLHGWRAHLRAASGPTPGRGSSASTRCSTPARSWARACSPTSSPSSRCRGTKSQLQAESLHQLESPAIHPSPWSRVAMGA